MSSDTDIKMAIDLADLVHAMAVKKVCGQARTVDELSMSELRKVASLTAGAMCWLAVDAAVKAANAKGK